MTYASRSIGSVLTDVNQTHFLPAIQRPYVWTPKQVIGLFDSLLRGYPINTFMFWQVDDATKAEVRAYKFIEHFRPDQQNEIAAIEGRQAVLVLDGQQRLTSLLIGLRGTFAEKAKGRHRSETWSARTLYIDLLKDPTVPDEDEDDGRAVIYGLGFHDKRPLNTHRHHWFKLGTILDFPRAADLERLHSMVNDDLHHGVAPYERQIAEDTLRRLHRAIWSDEVINFYTETDQSQDRVLDIFVRTNEGGVKLSKADLLMTLITSRWTGSAREDIFGFVEHINRGLGTTNKVTRDFVLKACLVLGDHDVTYNARNFTTQAITDIERTWPQITRAIENTFRLLNRHGLTADNLGSVNSVMPILYYLYHSPEFDFRGSSEFERVNAASMHRWLLNSLLVGAFVGASDQAITTARTALREHLKIARDFPRQQLFAALARGGRRSRIDEHTVEELLELQYGKPRTFVALSLLYPGLDWTGSHWHIDHIIPQADAQKSVLRSRNLPEHRINEILAARDSLGNLQLIRGDENIEKCAIPFRSWITGRDRGFLERHMIPDRPDLWDVTSLPDFVRAREALMRERLLGLARAVAA